MSSALSTHKENDNIKITVQRNRLASIETRMVEWNERLTKMQNEKLEVENLIRELEVENEKELTEQEEQQKTYKETLEQRLSQAQGT